MTTNAISLVLTLAAAIKDYQNHTGRKPRSIALTPYQTGDVRREVYARRMSMERGTLKEPVRAWPLLSIDAETMVCSIDGVPIVHTDVEVPGFFLPSEPYYEAPEGMSIVSFSTSDVQKVRVHYLDGTSEVLTLKGTEPVETRSHAVKVEFIGEGADDDN